MAPVRMIPKYNTVNILFFGMLLFVSLTLLPWYAISVGFSRVEWILFTVFVIVTPLSITMGYHRLFAHRSYEAHPVMTFLFLVFGAAAFQQSALMWASQHRDHHRFVDTEQDPYSIKKGFWYAHVGWLLLWTHETGYDNVPDLSNNRLIMQQHRYYLFWAIGAGVLLPLAIGAATGHFLGVLLLAVIGRLTLVHHATFCINSACHVFGRSTYDIDATARDHWFVAFVTFGEGYHNFHHRFARDYRNAVRWYQWDPGKWLISLMSWFGLAQKLYRTPQQRILAAKAAAERRILERALSEVENHHVAALQEKIRELHDALKTELREWRRLENEYRRIRDTVSEQSRAHLRAIKRKIAHQRRVFAEARRQWVNFVNTDPLIPEVAHI